jgi:pyruvate formate lyase activating enzyme
MDKRKFIKLVAASGAGCVLPTGATSRLLWGQLSGQQQGYERARYAMNTPRGIKCLLCPNECQIKEGERGDCRCRENKEGTLYFTGYERPCSLHVDPIEKKPLYHFLPTSRSYSLAVAGCNLACLNCQNWQISQVSPQEVEAFDLPIKDVYRQAQHYQCKSISYTYTEPIVFYEYMYDAAKAAKEQGIRNVMVSAGYINERPLRDLAPVIDAANIDLKSFSDETYMRMNAGSLQPVLRTLKILKEMGVWLELTNLVVPDWTDDMQMITKMCRWLYKEGFEDVPLHFSRFTPRYKLQHLPPTPESILNQARSIALDAGLHYVYIGNVGTTEAAHTYCPSCGTKVIERTGYAVRVSNLEKGCCTSCGTAIAGIWE